MSRIAPSSNYVDTFKLNRIANHHLCHARINQPKLNLVKFSTLFVNCINLSHPGYLKTSTYSPIQDISKFLHTLPSRISQNFYILSHPGYLKTSTYFQIECNYISNELMCNNREILRVDCVDFHFIQSLTLYYTVI